MIPNDRMLVFLMAVHGVVFGWLWVTDPHPAFAFLTGVALTATIFSGCWLWVEARAQGQRRRGR